MEVDPRIAGLCSPSYSSRAGHMAWASTARAALEDLDCNSRKQNKLNETVKNISKIYLFTVG